MPFSHGLFSTILCSLIIIAILFLLPKFRRQRDIPWWIGVAVFSHWILDFISHRPDLPLWGNSMNVGLGLWNYPTAAVVIEVGLFVAGAIWYAISVRGFKTWAAVLFWAFIIIATVVSSVRGSSMAAAGANQVAISALAFYLFATLLIYVIENNQRRIQ